MRQARQVSLDYDLPLLRVRDDPLAEGKQGTPLIGNVLALQEGPYIPDLLDDPGGNGIRIQAAPRQPQDLLLPGGQHEQLVVDLLKLFGDGRVVAVKETVSDAVNDPALLLLGGLDIPVDLPGVHNVPTDQLTESAHQVCLQRHLEIG